jgi:GNAT superfamily N-acetyltransferase
MPVEIDIARSGFTIRRAFPANAKAVRMLLPELQDSAVSLVAVDGERQLVVGAAGMTRSIRPQPLVGPGIAVRVIKPCRRHGIGASLVGHLERFARTAGGGALYGATRVEQSSDEMRGWQWLGFTPSETVEEHVLPLESFEARLGSLVDRMRARGRIPAGARIVPLYQASLPAVLQLHLDHLGGDRGVLYRKLRGQGAGAFLQRHSRVLLVDGQVRGCLLASRAERETITVDANIVESSLRGGWANAWLKLEAFRGAPAGVKRLRFLSFDHYADTRRFAQELGGATTRITVLMVRPLSPAS